MDHTFQEAGHPQLVGDSPEGQREVSGWLLVFLAPVNFSSASGSGAGDATDQRGGREEGLLDGRRGEARIFASFFLINSVYLLELLVYREKS